MPAINHVHQKECSRYEYKEWVPHVAPDVLWFNVQDVGSYSGQVYGFGVYQGKLLIYEDYYGSCSECGAWGEGGEPNTQKEILDKSKTFDTLLTAKEYLNKIDSYERPNETLAIAALEEADKFRPKKSESPAKAS